MFDPETLNQMESTLRVAIKSEMFAESRVLLERYALALEEHLKHLSSEPEQLACVAKPAYRLLDWAMAMTLSAREHSASASRTVHLVGSFHIPASSNSALQG